MYLITPQKGEAGSIETLPATEGMKIIKDHDLIQSDLKFNIEDKVCITSEASIEIVKERLEDDKKKNAIEVLKDKAKFREIISQWYPDYEFQSVAFDMIPTLKLNKKAVLKPSKGCFGSGVRIVDENTDFKQLASEIEKELQKNSAVLSENVLSQNEFILEEYIEGQEYAVDMYYDEKGDPHITSIYYHPMPKKEEYLHMIYLSSREVHQKIHDRALDFFKVLNESLNVKDFIMHSEFRMDKELIPIEINCMRFGGMGLGNMIYHVAGVNPYDSFQSNKPPNWNQIWNEQNEAIFAFFIAYNGSDIDVMKYKPDVTNLEKNFSTVIHHHLFDYQSQLAFGIYYLKENKENISRLLDIDFNDYFIKVD
jgi:hypothetical protein